ncbi:MAG: hypothetical protein JXL67_12845 [Calditrichaeota bacterium]|nr:hypothetical protein [Calditrichota bacterium]
MMKGTEELPHTSWATADGTVIDTSVSVIESVASLNGLTNVHNELFSIPSLNSSDTIPPDDTSCVINVKSTELAVLLLPSVELT